MKVPDESFDCVLYLPRQRLTRETILEICHTLWNHGMRFLWPHPLAGTWDEQLRPVPAMQSYADTSLSEQIDELVRERYGSVRCYDREVEFQLTFVLDAHEWQDTDGSSSERERDGASVTAGKVTLAINYPQISERDRIAQQPPDLVPETAYLYPPIGLAHLAMTHWVTVLCEYLHPAFAVGYYSTTSYVPSEATFTRSFDEAMIRALEANEYPPLHEWLSAVYVLYAPERLMTPARVEEWLTTPQCWTRRLSDSGWFAFALPETYEQGILSDLIAHAEPLLDQVRMSDDYSRLPEARAYALRALALEDLIGKPGYARAILLPLLDHLEQQRPGN